MPIPPDSSQGQMNSGKGNELAGATWEGSVGAWCYTGSIGWARRKIEITRTDAYRGLVSGGVSVSRGAQPEQTETKKKSKKSFHRTHLG